MAAAPLPTGEMDIFRHVQFGTIIVPRPFPSLAAAKEYFISALNMAQQMVHEAKNDSEADDAIARISDLFTLAFGRLRPLAEEANNREAYGPLVGMADQLAVLSQMAAVKKEEAHRRRMGTLVAEAIALIWLFFDLLGVYTSFENYRFFNIVAKLSPFLLMLSWGLFHETLKDTRKKVNKKLKRLQELERAGLYISNVTKKSICTFLAPPPAEV